MLDRRNADHLGEASMRVPLYRPQKLDYHPADLINTGDGNLHPGWLRHATAKRVEVMHDTAHRVTHA
jgi:hypothetical protein